MKEFSKRRRSALPTGRTQVHAPLVVRPQAELLGPVPDSAQRSLRLLLLLHRLGDVVTVAPNLASGSRTRITFMPAPGTRISRISAVLCHNGALRQLPRPAFAGPAGETELTHRFRKRIAPHLRRSSAPVQVRIRFDRYGTGAELAAAAQIGNRRIRTREPEAWEIVIAGPTS